MKFTVLFVIAAALYGQNRFTPGLQPFLTVSAPTVALTHVRIIDGTGAAPSENQTIVIDHGKIAAVGPAASVAIPTGAQTLDYSGNTVIPGMVGMHEHLFYPSGGGIPMYNEMAFSFPRLYLASGITSARTGGSLEPYADLNVKRLIDAGRMPGPHMFITGPYLEGPGSIGAQMHELSGPDDAVRMVDYWASVGVTSFKAYMHITRAELKAAVDEAHKRRYQSHGPSLLGWIPRSRRHRHRQPRARPARRYRVSPRQATGRVPGPGRHAQRDGAARYRGPADARYDRRSGAPQRSHHVDSFGLRGIRWQPSAGRAALPRFRFARGRYFLSERAWTRPRRSDSPAIAQLKKELEFEVAFVKAGGLLVFGCDPTGNGGAMAGFGDQRNLELLVEGGFTPVQAIQIATQNGAKLLGELDSRGTITAGKIADLVVIDGNPAARIADIRKIKVVFKDGAGYDPAKLVDSVHGAAGMH